MLRIVAAMTLMSPILDAPQPDQLTLDPLGWAAHQSALCKCPDPLVNYLTYRMPMQLDGQPLAPRREGG
ncbi:MAG: hypothetical protein HKN49_07935, partial [Gammaproteobacteria bacterium]|nr:hypothetical protein [Gammaproteobacteria bacterium]